MELSQQFEAAVLRSKEIATRPSNEQLLQLYALYKQATVGDVKDAAPNMVDFKAYAKYKAWEEQKGKSLNDAMSEYITLVNSLM